MLNRLKTIYLALIGCGFKKFKDTLLKEQELLLAMADISIQIFAMESVVLRSEKIFPNASTSKGENLKAVVTVFCFTGTEKIVQSARKSSFFLEENERLDELLDGIQHFAEYRPQALLEARRYLADKALETEKYFF